MTPRATYEWAAVAVAAGVREDLAWRPRTLRGTTTARAEGKLRAA